MSGIRLRLVLRSWMWFVPEVSWANTQNTKLKHINKRTRWIDDSCVFCKHQYPGEPTFSLWVQSLGTPPLIILRLLPERLERKQRTSNALQSSRAADWCACVERSSEVITDTVSHLCCMFPLAVTVMNAGESSMASKNSASSFSSLASPSWDRSAPTAASKGQTEGLTVRPPPINNA